MWNEKCRKLKSKYKLNKENITRVKETVKQRIQLKAQRVWSMKSVDNFITRTQFLKMMQKKFYREIGK